MWQFSWFSKFRSHAACAMQTEPNFNDYKFFNSIIAANLILCTNSGQI